MRIPAFWRALWCLVAIAALTLTTALYTLTWSRGSSLKTSVLPFSSWNTKPSSRKNATAETPNLLPGTHPIQYLMTLATKHFTRMQANEIHSLDQAAAQYRKLRKRHPPPGFDAWYAYAKSHDAIVNERFWDQIYDDLAPFWSIDPTTLRKQAHVLSPKLSVRSGKVEGMGDEIGKMGVWAEMLQALAVDLGVSLPDVDLPLNTNDSPAMLVPWESTDTALSLTRPMMPDIADILSNFSDLSDIADLTKYFPWKPEWLGPRLTHPSSHLGPRPLWSLVTPVCAPGTPARLGKVFNDIWDPQGAEREEHLAVGLMPKELPEGSLGGYVKSWGEVVDVCAHPELQGLHSSLVAPKEMGVSTSLFPIFGGRKISVGNEILLPSTMNWNATYAVGSTAVDWEEKENKLFWRGKATVGHEPERYWKRFQTERLVSMLNATHVEIAEAAIHTGNESTVGVSYAGTFRLLPLNQYNLQAQKDGKLAEWVNSWADAALEDLGCEPGDNKNGCDYIQEYFAPTPASGASKAKYAASIDTASDSFVANLRQGRVTLRASIYRNWYDSRLIPWLHFVPMDNTFIDLYGIMEYFLGPKVPDTSKDFAHAVGEVQMHEHHFKTPEGVLEHEYEHVAASSQSGNEPTLPGSGRDHKSKRAPNDEAARRIAEAIRDWAGKVLRQEDMLIYVYRLVLEYARVVDTRRERLGWVGDLKEGRWR